MSTWSDAALYVRARACLDHEVRLFASGPGSRLHERPGVLASIVPGTPDRSLFNAIAYRGHGALLAAYDELAAAYAAAGVRAFTVFVESDDDATRAALRTRGHKLDSSPEAMAAPLDEIRTPEIGELDWRATRDWALVARINDQAYGFPPPGFGGVGGVLAPPWYAYVARLGDEDVGCLMCVEYEVDGALDCGLCGVATLPAAQGSGIATRLLALALDEARRRGCVTTSLQASPRGRPVYERLGYRGFGPIEMWERRE